MSKQLLNEAELLLLRQWDEARLLEQSMERVREKYAALFEQVVEAVKEAHPELDVHKVYAKQFWTKGEIGFGRKSWPGGDDYYVPGPWIDNLRLEVLAAEEEPEPVAGIWLPPKVFKTTSLTMTKVREEVLNAAASVLSQDEHARHVRTTTDAEYAINFIAPSKKEVIDMFATGEGETLVRAMANQFNLMAKFVPVLDRLLANPV